MICQSTRSMYSVMFSNVRLSGRNALRYQLIVLIVLAVICLIMTRHLVRQHKSSKIWRAFSGDFTGDGYDVDVDYTRSEHTDAAKILYNKTSKPASRRTKPDEIDYVMRQNSDKLPERSAFGVESTENICLGDDAKHCVFLPVQRPYKVAVNFKHKVGVCVIPKSGETITKAIFCYLSNPERWIANNRHIHNSTWTDCDYDEYLVQERYTKMDSVAKRLNYSSIDEWFGNWSMAVVVRDPIDHFLSGYTDVCLRRGNPCYGCQRNVTCFILNHYEHLIRRRGRAHGEVEVHIRPQANNCELNNPARYDQYDKLPFDCYAMDLTILLRRAGVEERHIDYINEGLKMHTAHSTVQRPDRQFFEKRVRSSPFLMEYIIRIMYEDYRVFNMRWPILRFPKQ